MSGGRKPAERIAAIERIYASLPELECRGQCYDSCGPITMTKLEFRRIERVGHHSIGLDLERFRCTALSEDNRCTVYPLRPAICRLWGMTEAMQCTYGCVPVGGYLSEVEGYTFLARVADAAGDVVAARRFWRVVAMNPTTEQVIRQRRGDNA